jgi:hypothetical protein
MQIVTRQQLMAMPRGAVYHQWTPTYFGDMCIKGETLFNENGPVDWYETTVPWVGGADDMLDKLDAGEAMAVDMDTEGREGLYDDSLRYAVWSQADVTAFVRRLINDAAGAKIADPPQSD